MGEDATVPLSGVAVSPLAVLAGLAVGIHTGAGTTLLAALVPARAATRVFPLVC